VQYFGIGLLKRVDALGKYFEGAVMIRFGHVVPPE
jgi:hypothetical protein